MINSSQFQQLLESPESSILDFKKEMYNFSNDADKKKIGMFIKDIICFCNTIRNESSYIIIGVGESEGNKHFVGINELIDDAILQEKVKSKISPRPVFSFYTLVNNNIQYGVFEFPVVKYPHPLMPTEKIRGLEIGKIYHRKGSSNSEAMGMEGIYINDWLRSIPEKVPFEADLNEKISNLIKRATASSDRISSIIADAYGISKEYNLEVLKAFCEIELLGIQEFKPAKIAPKTHVKYAYRVQHGYQSLDKIELGYMQTASSVKNAMDNDKKFYKMEILFSLPIKIIEDHLNHFDPEKGRFMVVTENDFMDVFPEVNEERGLTIYRYLFVDSFRQLYSRITQKFIEVLVAI